jgi:formate hydrogenlyase subunit 6/NADH:ubiquinone oxidoreductase subunit I
VPPPFEVRGTCRGKEDDMVNIDKDKCIGCGLCVRICHEGCMALTDDGRVSVNYDLCSTCTQCVAVCPQQALCWGHVPPVTYDATRLPSGEQLDELFKERRTIRRFRAEKIDRLLLEEIVGYGAYAPTNNYAPRAVVVDDEAMMEELERIILQFVRRVYNLFFRSRIVFNLIRMITPAMDAKDKVKMESDLEKGDDFDLPAAMVFILGDTRIALSLVSAQYALYNMILYAQAKGIGTRLKGTGQVFLDRSRSARRCLGLQRHEHILGTLELGYPAVKFANKVEGKTLSIQWNGGGCCQMPKGRRHDTIGSVSLEAVHDDIEGKG